MKNTKMVIIKELTNLKNFIKSRELILTNLLKLCMFIGHVLVYILLDNTLAWN